MHPPGNRSGGCFFYLKKMQVITTNFTTSIVPEDILSLASLKEHCRIDYTDEDAILSSYRSAAIAKVQNLSGRMLDRVTVEFFAEHFGCIRLPWSPVASITSVEYKTDATTYATLAAANWWCDVYRDAPHIDFKNLPTVYQDTANKIKITAEIGYDASAGNVPEPLIAAVRLLAQDMYEFRGDEVAGVVVRKVPNGVNALISEFRTI